MNDVENLMPQVFSGGRKKNKKKIQNTPTWKNCNFFSV